jgi:LysM repeat protein
MLGPKTVELNLNFTPSRKMKKFLPLVLFLGGCGSHLANLGETHRQRDLAFDEMRIELGDLRHAVQAQRTDLALLQERLQDQETLFEQTSKNKIHVEPLMARLSSLEKKLPLLEKQHERIINDMTLLKKLYEQSGTNVHNIQEKLSSLQLQIDQCSSRLSDIQQLKSTLTQVSRAIGDKTNSTPSSNRRYRVKAGDNLDKIAKQQHISVSEIKRLNNLQSDKIFVGQELVLNSDE